ncbi:MAG: hypothetical protein EHM72_03095 [Calditrichaeota bacterium]|nr:MAG: hypothetical protein EHM72_03095 [Calditrichota bacterium]
MPKLPVIRADFTKNVFKLMSGTALAHLTTLLATPILTRLFAKESLGDLQLFLSTVTTFGVVASLKYEMAIVLPKENEEGNELAVLSLAVLGIFSLLFTLLLAVTGKHLLRLLNAESLQPYLYFIAVGVFLFGFWQALQYVLVRFKKFGVLATNKVIQVAAMNIITILLGFFWRTTMALFYAQLFGWAIAAYLVWIKSDLHFRVTWRRLYFLAKEYIKFPTVNTALVFLNTFSMQLPVFMFSRYFGVEIVALYSMANRIVSIPLFMVGTSVQQVYFRAASEAKHQGRDALLQVYRKTVRSLALFALLPLGILLLFGPQIARVYFGQSYAESGVYMQIITFWMLFQFINSPISATFTILDKQQIGFYLILISLVLRFVVMALYHSSARGALAALSLTAGLFYLFYNLTIFYFIKKMDQA